MEEDDTLSREENIRCLTEFIDRTAEKILSADIPLWVEPSDDFFVIPDPVIEEFLQAPENEKKSSFLQREDTQYYMSRTVQNSSSLPNELNYTIEARFH